MKIVLLKMTRKAFKKNYQENDRFDRKQKRHSSHKEGSSKHKYSIYDEFSDEEDYDLQRTINDFSDEEE